MPEIISDKDLPMLLNTPSKRVKWAEKLVSSHLGSAAKRLDNPPLQGMFSKTLMVTLANSTEVVVQFRTEPVDVEAFHVAKRVLGSLVPDIQALTDEDLEKAGAWAYYLSLIPGKMWLRGVAGKGAEGRIAVNKSLGRVFSRGFLAPTSTSAVNDTVRPHLQAILSSPLDEIAPHKAICQQYLDKLDDIAKLPLWISHYDLNDVNVMIDDSCEVTGLIDWELSKPLPFGVGLGRIHTLAGEYYEGEFWMPPEFEEAEKGFWSELFSGMPDSKALNNQMDLVQDAVILGTLLSTFIFEEGKVGFSPISLKTLPKLLTYRLPLVRGDDPPYAV